MAGIWWGAEVDEWPPTPPDPEVTITENPIVGELFAPDGTLLAAVRARPTIPFGFAPRTEEA